MFTGRITEPVNMRSLDYYAGSDLTTSPRNCRTGRTLMVHPFRNSSPVLTVRQPLSSVCPLLFKQGAVFIFLNIHTFKQLHVSSVPLDPGVAQSCSSLEFLLLIKYSTAALLHKITEKLFVLTKDRLYLHSATPPFVHKKETGGAGGDGGNETQDVL